MALRRPRRPSAAPDSGAASSNRPSVRPIQISQPQTNVPPHLQLRTPTVPVQRTSGGFAALLGNLLWVLVGMVAGLLILAVYLYSGDLLPPGSRALNMDLGGLSVSEATTLMDQHWQQRTIRLEAGSNERTEISLESLGIDLDAAATVETIHARSRTRDGLMALVRGDSQETAPILRVDGALAASSLRTVTAQFEIPATDANVDLIDGRAEMVDPVVGRTVNIDATVALLMDRLGRVIADERLPLVIESVPPRTPAANLAEIAAQINALLAAPVDIELYDPINNQSIPWRVAPQVWADWLVLDLYPADGSPFQWAIDPAQVKGYFDREAAALGPGRYIRPEIAVPALDETIRGGEYSVELRVYHSSLTHVVQPGETLSSIAWDYGMPYPWLEAANPNVAGGIFAGQQLTIPSVDQLLPLPVVRNKRIIVSLSEQRMWAYENGALRWEWPVSTGIESSPTSPGVFQIQSHESNAYAGNWDLWMPSFMGIYRPVPHVDFMNGFHGFPTRNGSTLLWTEDLGRPVTFGCILLSSDNAALLFEWAEEGVVVEVKR